MVDRFDWPSCTSLHSEPQDEAPRIGERCGPTQPKRARAANTVNGTPCSTPSPAFTAGIVQARRGRNRSRSGAGFDCFPAARHAPIAMPKWDPTERMVRGLRAEGAGFKPSVPHFINGAEIRGFCAAVPEVESISLQGRVMRTIGSSAAEQARYRRAEIQNRR